MGLSNALGRYVVPRAGENNPVWDGQTKGRYEVWYLTLNVPSEKVAFWLRYTLESPLTREPYAEVWGHFFDGSSPGKSFGVRRRYPRSDLALGGGALIQIGSSRLDEGRAVGPIQAHGHRINWDLRSDSSPTAFFLAPLPLRPLVSRRRTNWCVPNRDVKYRGKIIVDDRTFEVGDAPGQQAHLWGGRHAKAWTWLHCNAFDGGARVVVEATAPTIPFAGRERTLTLVYVQYEGKDYLCNALPQALYSARSEIAFPEWRFFCGSNGTTFRGRVVVDPRKILQVQYADPDGAARFCCNSELADLELEVQRGGRTLDVLRATGTANAEFGSPERRAEIPLCPGA